MWEQLGGITSDRQCGTKRFLRLLDIGKGCVKA